jgi:hypothetical protein
LDLAALQSASGLQAAEFEASLRPAAAEADVKGVPMSVFNTLSEADQKLILGIVEKKADVKGVPRDLYDQLPEKAQNQILGLASDQQIFNVGGSLISVNTETNTTSVIFQKDTRELREVNGELVVADPRTGTVISIFGEGEVAAPDYRIIRDISNGLTTTIDVSTATGRAAIDMANAANAQRRHDPVHCSHDAVGQHAAGKSIPSQ